MPAPAFAAPADNTANSASFPVTANLEMANAIRALAMDGVEAANSGHPGMPMGMADVASVLWAEVLRHNPQDPLWADRDRFVLSAGHGSMLLYALLHLTGYQDFGIEDLKKFRQLGSHTHGHPEVMPGIETTTGPLGQGIANAVGMALAERHLNARFGDGLVNHRTFAIAGDGCLMEGISHEAISFAGHLGLNKLTLLFDDNQISIDGATNLSVSDDQRQRFAACGWHTLAVDGHDMAAVRQALAEAASSDKPTMIACRTVIGFGADKAGSSSMHGSPLGADGVAAARKNLNWPYAAFEIPESILNQWRTAGQRSAPAYQAWQQRLNASAAEQRLEFNRLLARELPNGWQGAIAKAKQIFVENPKAIASRAASGEVLGQLVAAIPELVGGSADLTPSNNTRTKTQDALTHQNYAGRYIHHGVREHGMAAVMNGLALHGGIIPYAGTFLVFSDYARPAIRLSALMRQRVIYVMTHDSIGLGEDGPTHQPVEHLASLRAIPNLLVLRPGDAVETAECWEIALQQTSRPSILALSRQNLPLLRTKAGSAAENENRSARGAYAIAGNGLPNQVVLLASGSEVGLAKQVADQLVALNIGARVISCPSLELLMEQPASYRQELLGGEGVLRVAIEAGVRQSWDRLLRENDLFIGMSDFGASGKAEDLFKHFGFTAEAIIGKIRAIL
jgi:transketolase